MKKLYFLGLISLWGISLSGQIILHRQIVDEQNRPMAGISIWRNQIEEVNVTDEKGWFSFTFFPGIDILEISHPGFKPVIIQTSTELTLSNEITINLPLYDDMPNALIGKEIMPEGIPEAIMTPQTYYSYFFHIPVVLTKIPALDSLSFPDFLAARVRVFPIPTANILYLQEETTLGQVDLYNLNGQKLKSFNFNQQLNASIDLGNLPSGTYFLRSNKGWTEKVILQKQ